MGGGDCVELPEELRRLIEERLVPEVINGLVVTKHVRTSFCPVIFSSTYFLGGSGTRVHFPEKDVDGCIVSAIHHVNST